MPGFHSARKKVLMTYISFRLTDSPKMSGKEMWVEFVKDWNSRSPLTANYAFPVSRSWVDEVSKTAIISSVVSTVVVCAVSIFLCMVVITCNLGLAGVGVLLTFSVIICMTFCLVCVFVWTLGPSELLGIIVFVGYASTFPLHVSHAYMATWKQSTEHLRSEVVRFEAKAAQGIHPGDCQDIKDIEYATVEMSASEVRKMRAKITVCEIGGAIVGASATTIGSAVMMLFCKAEILFKMGVLVITVTLLAMFVSLVILPTIIVLTNFECKVPYKRKKAVLEQGLYSADVMTPISE